MKKRIRILPPPVTIGGSLLFDGIAILLADLVSFIVKYRGFTFGRRNFEAYLHLAAFIFIARYISIYIFNLYRKQRHKSTFEVIINSIKACTASSIVIIVFLYFREIEAYPRSVALYSWLFSIIFISFWRMAAKWILGTIFGRDLFRSHFLVIGTGVLALQTAQRMKRSSAMDCSFMGFLAVDKDAPVQVHKDDILGALDYLPFIIERCYVDEVILADENISETKMARLLQALSTKRVPLTSTPAATERVVRNTVLNESSSPFAGPAITRQPAEWYPGLKRVGDVILSLFIMVITLPVFLLATLLVKFTSPGPVFYLQKRMGLNGRRFTIIKLRTMYADSEQGRPRWAEKNDTRITPVGKWLRRLRIDELPQLWNVLRNDMSLIGPRPERPYFYSILITKIPFYSERLLVKPGLTGWAQIKFRYADTIEKAEEKFLYDLYYIQNMSLALDTLITLETIKVVLTGQGAH